MKQNKIKYWSILLILLMVILILVSLLSLCVGSAGIQLKNIPDILLHGKGSADHSILLGIRLPRIVLGLSIGGALSLAGALLQGIFKNPLVEPYTLGISGGASLGVCINILFKFYGKIGIIAYPLSGFLGASLVIFLVYSLNNKARDIQSNRMLLTGVMISYVASSLVMLLMAISKSDDLQNIVLWIMGSLDEPNTILIKMALFGSLAGLVVSYFFCFDLNALLLGEDEAANLGVNTTRTKKYLFILASFLTGLSVSVAGIIMFAGLIVPHFMRMIAGPDHRILLISSFLAGAAFLVLCDVIARVIISPLELPVGVITGIIGGIIFIWALSRKQVTL
ncbi:iron ABC transporter permease [Desulfobacula sp.]|uniref:FecCD family ABC transporter permease n=1 Tax=Desulfobacula sp. TaxID=2593537 RepID=UPI0025BE64D2|nr:iron ABC transporter permease [Desulfobacula sp.]MBC2705379.1 iron ABC transporter permease [Desulfobacula sp.]MCK4767864.1 iron ABC transporter permease [Desulfobacula sp.]